MLQIKSSCTHGNLIDVVALILSKIRCHPVRSSYRIKRLSQSNNEVLSKFNFSSLLTQDCVYLSYS